MNIGFNKYLFIKFLNKIYSILIQIHSKYLSHIVYKLYFKYIMKQLLPYFHYSIHKLKNSNYKGQYNSHIIWLFWWQGYDYMPRIVHLCINSIINNSSNYTVKLITNYNIHEYTDIPKYIFNRVKHREISLTHFSDIVRFNLLRRYGGLWCDATIYCASPITIKYFNFLYSSGGYKNTYPQFVNGRWTGFLIGGNKDNALFIFMCNYFESYWKNNKRQISYFLIDLGLYYAYINNIGGFRVYIDNRACYNNPNLFKLVNYLNKPFNVMSYLKLIKGTNMFKLTYKQKLNNKHNTLYAKLLRINNLI